MCIYYSLPLLRPHICTECTENGKKCYRFLPNGWTNVNACCSVLGCVQFQRMFLNWYRHSLMPSLEPSPTATMASGRLWQIVLCLGARPGILLQIMLAPNATTDDKALEIQYNTIQYNTIQCNAIQCNAIQYNTIQYNTIQYNAIQYNTIQYNIIQYNTMQCNTIQCNTIQYNTIQYNAIQYNTILPPMARV